MRDSYSIGLLGSIKETILIAAKRRSRAHLDIKALGPEVWGQAKQAIELIRKARAEGVEASALPVPIRRFGNNPGGFPGSPLAEVGGRAELIKRIDDPQVRPRLLRRWQRI